MREPAVSGTFYPPGKDELANMIDGFIKEARLSQDVENAVSYVAPHAGYVYSGRTAAYAFSAMQSKKGIESIESFVVIGPNHTGHGKPMAVSMQDWKIPLGVMQNDKELSSLIAKADGIDRDEEAHRDEHSVEVQLPFIKQLFPDAKCCFICMGNQSIEAAHALSDAVADAVKRLGRKAIVLASSDFNHYESRAVAQRKDRPLFELLEKMDVEGFYRRKGEQNESACGYGPISTALLYAKKVHNASKGVLLHNSDSGDETGDTENVVDYASLCFL
ncbi:MAG: AmmeMemoRadiSam system protein B [Candidatus Marsarchaeota archaeon]|jgi:AmmeMemoRadiSam system protein B|nr:AmmeMemoRadiSam system protein B [Candidatus Marsarchaeota archaeon]MCL5111827.1 AmmeMemoRadiSam system protein B [Candidatus Marsarchaeota archaeon]